MLEYEKKKTAEALEQVRENEGKKEEMKENFVSELLRRQSVSGTFEDAIGRWFAHFFTPPPLSKP